MLKSCKKPCDRGSHVGRISHFYKVKWPVFSWYTREECLSEVTALGGKKLLRWWVIMVLMDRYCLPEDCFSNRWLPEWARLVAILPVFLPAILSWSSLMESSSQSMIRSPVGCYMLKPCPLNSRWQELSQTLMLHARMLLTKCVKLNKVMSIFKFPFLKFFASVEAIKHCFSVLCSLHNFTTYLT